MNKKRLSWALVATYALALPHVASSAELPATTRYVCKFNMLASPDGLENAKNFSLQFLLETASGKAVMIGNNGMTDVTIVNGAFGLTYLEFLSTGVVQSTTIVNATHDAVHSRHSIIGSDLVPSQYYGKCEVGPG